jgi:maltose alpha-D-glucosyltransferase/alpha-amylase
MTVRKGHSAWYKDAIIYELHVKAFFDRSANGTGDFRGLMEKLDYLQDLGITAIWLLPFFPSPLRDDGYDIADYRGVHPEYGKLREFKAFVREAHRRNIRVIIELVINHTSDQHRWFQAARRAKPGSAKRNFYVWSNADTKFPETRIIFTDTESSNWSWDPLAGAYYWHRFFSHQPDLNHNNPQVVKAVIRILRFWLDMGVDGLRLDAVPYLCVREGTNNENLPETHAAIKEIRRQVDLHYADRMLLAEANQWPQDVVEYFGNGDECHMCFHFPLMPRIFMAIRREDRHPIMDILKLTPPIPDNCQWALFLRNHDELTLEMVTDEERDYMYREYAKDSRMRLNSGIRRRLAPLVDNSMRRIELLNSLLFSFPGTPIIYCGDEIGMGDNFYLGDRDGVRTPMQWSADRNAGFSRADPARLYLPVIMDPVYGYEAVNVEAQQRNPSSLLHFMKRMIALRRQHKAFGRGTMEFLYPENRKVLVYVRRYKGEIILAVANLSRFAQPVELDLSEFRGWTPVEMIGRTEFPPIGELPYFLTVGPHAFYWFRLEPQAEAVSIPAALKLEEMSPPRLSLQEGSENLLEQEYRYTLENDIIARYLSRQRWFRGKAREVVSVRIVDWSKVGGGFYVVLAEVKYADEALEVYSLPIKVVMGKAAEKFVREIPAKVLASIKTPKGEGVLFDALAERTACCDFFSAIVDGRTYPTSLNGRIRAYTTQTYREATEADLLCTGVRRFAGEQSNTSMVLDERFVLKFFRCIEQGLNPDVEIGLFLTESTEFGNFPEVAGCLEYAGTGAPSTLAMLQVFAPNQGDGWDFTLRALRGFYQECLHCGPDASALLVAGNEPALSPPPEIPELVRAIVQPYLEAILVLGRRTAEFHLALSGERRNRAFAAEPMTAEYLEAWVDEFSHQAHEVLGLLNANLQNLPADALDDAREVLVVAPNVMTWVESLTGMRTTAVRIRCHGDFHLGQVLRVDDDFFLLDFEGEPLRPLAERRAKHSPLKDVAGMVRSFSYAVYNGLLDASRENAELFVALEPWAQAWERWSAAAFVRAYIERADGAPFVPDGRDQFETLLRAFLLEKAFYELGYELNNRPDWVRMPLKGILELARKPAGGGQGLW